ncbi:phytoene desaturase family protein [Streptomyces sp. NPDC127068]|uniref:phytoene desaturase family protein n=1 Tax=Streptomyces sp. NPDC127068 TaxID=3347127 RepID=UPI0036478174
MRTVRGSTDDVVVIGAGLAGLATALHLVGAGRSVTLLEQNEEPGGKAGRFVSDGYAFDNGPTVLTAPGLIQQTFAAVGEDTADRLELLPVEPMYRAHFHDGSTIDAVNDPHAMAAEIGRVCGAREAAGFRRFATFLEQLYAAEYRHFIDRNIDGPFDLDPSELARLIALGAFRSMESKVRQYLHDPRAVRLFSFQALYAGVAPHHVRALYSVITYMGMAAGVFLPRGGMHALPLALTAAARDHGVVLRCSTKAERIETSLHGTARAVITSAGERLPADAVVVAAEPSVALPRLLGRTRLHARRISYAPSCLLWLTGAPAPEPSDDRAPAHHNVHFGASWRGAFDDIVRDGRLMRDPSFLVSAPTVTDPALAPVGQHNYHVVLPTPNLKASHQNMPMDSERCADYVRRALVRHGYEHLLRTAGPQHMITPLDWERRGCPAGTPFGAAHTLRQTGPFRTSNLLGDNIVLAGAGTHPGVGIPMALISGRLAAQRITGPVTSSTVRSWAGAT